MRRVSYWNPFVSQDHLYETEFLLAYRGIVNPLDIKSLDYGEVQFLIHRLTEQIKKEQEEIRDMEMR
jgi:hypothetical protein